MEILQQIKKLSTLSSTQLRKINVFTFTNTINQFCFLGQIFRMNALFE